MWWRVLVLVGVLAAATALGVWWRGRNGRIATPAGRTGSAPTEAARAEREQWRRLGFDPAEARLTMVQFSSAFCQPCRATRGILADVAAGRPGVRHVEVDAESHLDVVRALDIRRTPTVMLVDDTGRIVGRASGQPRKAEVVAVVAALGAGQANT